MSCTVDSRRQNAKTEHNATTERSLAWTKKAVKLQVCDREREKAALERNHTRSRSNLPHTRYPRLFYASWHLWHLLWKMHRTQAVLLLCLLLSALAHSNAGKSAAGAVPGLTLHWPTSCSSCRWRYPVFGAARGSCIELVGVYFFSMFPLQPAIALYPPLPHRCCWHPHCCSITAAEAWEPSCGQPKAPGLAQPIQQSAKVSSAAKYVDMVSV